MSARPVVRRLMLLTVALFILACSDEQRTRVDSAQDAPSFQTIDSTVAPANTDTTNSVLPRDSSFDTIVAPRRPTPLPMPQGEARDTLRGVVTVVGSEPMVQVDLRTSTGRHVHLVGDLQVTLRRVSGADIWVEGFPTEGTRPGFDVRQFAVRSVDGVPAIDGTLVRDDGRVHIATANGKRVALAVVPPALADQIGARVWISGDPPNSIAAYGIIVPRPR